MKELSSGDYNNHPKELTLGQWILTLFITFIPLVNMIVLLIWAFGEGNPRKNFSRAYLIWIAISILLSLILFVIMFAIFSSVPDYYYY